MGSSKKGGSQPIAKLDRKRRRGRVTGQGYLNACKWPEHLSRLVVSLISYLNYNSKYYKIANFLAN